MHQHFDVETEAETLSRVILTKLFVLAADRSTRPLSASSSPEELETSVSHGAAGEARGPGNAGKLKSGGRFVEAAAEGGAIVIAGG